jgi:hypothetical protein
MKTYSTRDAAKKLGIAMSTLSRHIRLKKVGAPKSVTSGGMTIHLWTEEEIEHVRRLLPKIVNGRKTRYQKLREKQKNAPAGVPVPHKQRRKQAKTKKKR